jgi:hypothetical protein
VTTDGDLIRSLVREALRDAVAAQPELLGRRRPAAAVTEYVSVANDADLAKFVARVLDLAEDDSTRAHLRSGHISFALGSQPSADATHSEGVMRVERGAVTESMVRKAAEVGAELHLGPRAVLTSLAKDKARAMGVTIVKTSHNTKGNR